MIISHDFSKTIEKTKIQIATHGAVLPIVTIGDPSSVY